MGRTGSQQKGSLAMDDTGGIYMYMYIYKYVIIVVVFMALLFLAE